MLPSTAVTLSVGALLVCSALIQCSVFLDRSAAGQILRSSARRRRANSHFLEEMLPGNLERECYEERCSLEEATEIFQTQEKTMEFWYRYTNLNPCRTNPCLNGGMCTLDRGDFACLCPPQYQGKICDTVVFPCGRQQMEALDRGRSLLSSLEMDDATWDYNATDSWLPELNSTEAGTANATGGGGNLTDGGGAGGSEMKPRIVGGSLERRGGSPWQVLIHRSDGFGFCGGTLVSDRWVVSAAHCFEESADHVTIGDYDKQRPDPGEQQIKIQKVIVHPHFHAFTFDSDLALLYLAWPVQRGPTAVPACLPDTHLSKYLLKEDNHGVVTGWGATEYLGRSSRFLRKVTLPVVGYKDCISTTEQVITDNMFCAGYLEASKDACSGDSGGPFVVNYRGTWFLTGVVSWGEKCAARGKYGVYTRLGNFLNWIRDTMERRDLNGTGSP
ncbi:coagulation factor X isoform X2 [Oreochromis aureus]|uniref:coagulation factor X isoform X2 n=1 Tax=Oreochromis aureus TaxID=47969 RepID=UPI00195478B1|nr:coagulation factor X isoform X2 [Oreochromis aureus]